MLRLPIYVAIAVTIVVIPSLMDPINLPKLLVLSIGSGLLLPLFYPQIIHCWRDKRRVVAFFPATFLLGLVASSLASEQGIYRTVVGVWGRNNVALMYISLLILFLSLATMKSSSSSIFLVSILTKLGIAGTVYGFIQSAGFDPITWNNQGSKIILTLGNSNFASAFLALTGIATLTIVLKPELETWKRVSFSISYLLQMYLTYKSDSIQGFIVLILGSLTLVGFLLSTSGIRKIKYLGISWWGMILISGVFGIVGLLGNGPLSTILNPSLRSLRDRYYHWQAAGSMLKENIFFGVGIDSFGDYYRQFRIPEAIQLRGNATSGTNNAHNTIMQIGATGGLVLLIPYLLLIAFIAYRGLIAIKKNQDKVLSSGVFSIWIAFQIQSLVSIDQIGLVIWGWAAGGCLVTLSFINSSGGSPEKKTKISTRNGRVVLPKTKFVASALLLLGFVPSVFLSLNVWSEFTLRNQIIELISSGTTDSAAMNGKKLFNTAKDASHPELRLQAANYLIQMGQYDEALELTKLNNSQFPNSFESWDATAQIYEGLGDKKSAIGPRSKTVLLDPLNAELRQLLEKDQTEN
jgi:O-antigen ligase